MKGFRLLQHTHIHMLLIKTKIPFLQINCPVQGELHSPGGSSSRIGCLCLSRAWDSTVSLSKLLIGPNSTANVESTCFTRALFPIHLAIFLIAPSVFEHFTHIKLIFFRPLLISSCGSLHNWPPVHILSSSVYIHLSNLTWSSLKVTTSHGYLP